MSGHSQSGGAVKTKRKVTPKSDLAFPENPKTVVVRKIIRDEGGAPVLDADGKKKFKLTTYSVGEEVGFLNVHTKNAKNSSDKLKARIDSFAIVKHTGVVRATGTVVGKSNKDGRPQVLSMMLGSFQEIPK